MPIATPRSRLPSEGEASLDRAMDRLGRLDATSVSAFVDGLLAYAGAEGKYAQDVVLSQLIEVLSVSAEDGLSMIQVSLGLVDLLCESSESLSEAEWMVIAWRSMGEIEQRSSLAELLRAIYGRRSAFADLLARLAAESGVMPSFDHLDFSAELRAIYRRGPGSANAIDAEPAGFVPVATLMLWVDSGVPGTLAFQANLKQLRNLQSSINAAVSRLDTLGRFANFRQEGSND